MSAYTGRTAVVTGASSGIGRASAEALVRAGFTVFGTSRRPTGEAPDGVTMLACDVTDDASVHALVSAVLAQTGRIDVLVNNAGLGLSGGAEESSIGQVQALFDVNLFGAMRVTNAVLPPMRQRGAGRIVNVSSVLGLVPAPFSAHYAATKHALEGYSESLDHEVRAFGVRVSLIEPAYVQSAFDRSSLEPDARLTIYDRARTGMQALVKEVLPSADLPGVAAQGILRAATDARPRRRYATGKTARQVIMLRRVLPARTFDRLFRKQMRLPA